MANKRFQVVLNWYGEITTLWTHATSTSQAKAFVLEKFAKSIGRTKGSVLAYFNGSKDNILIKEA